MILQALTQLYRDLVDRNEIAQDGWSPTKVSYALCLSETGALENIVPQGENDGKKNKLRPTQKCLPAPVKRSSGIKANFLWDNSQYLLGIAEEKDLERSQSCFRSSAELHHQLLKDVSTPTAKAILSFFDKWDPETAMKHPLIAGCPGDLLKGTNLIFRVNGIFAQEDPQIQEAWNKAYGKVEGEKQQCLITGNFDIPEETHPAIKGVRDAQSSGANIVSFNAPAFCSYGKEKNFNAPIGKNEAFAYTAALNHLLADQENVHQIGDATVVCWADCADPQYNFFSNFALFGDSLPETWTQSDLRSALSLLSQGLPCEKGNLDPKRNFYILGLSPNAARISVRFFYRNSFGKLMKNVNDHYERLEIEGKRTELLSPWGLLRETVNQNATNKTPNPVLSGAVARSIFMGIPYPAALLQGVMLRIRAEREITAGRAAILKAYYLKNPSEGCPKEVLTVSLNENSTNIPYTLGRLFAVYEELQEKANPGINATIKDKYFNAAAATPATIFPILDNLSQKHLRKLEQAFRVYFDRRIGELKEVLGEEYPVRTTLPEQGSFNLGYYHQKQQRYKKKEEK